MNNCKQLKTYPQLFFRSLIVHVGTIIVEQVRGTHYDPYPLYGDDLTTKWYCPGSTTVFPNRC